MAKLVAVYSTESEGEAQMVQGLLESHGIRCILAGEAVSIGRNQREGVEPGPQITLMVPTTEEEKAKKVLELVQG